MNPHHTPNEPHEIFFQSPNPWDHRLVSQARAGRPELIVNELSQGARPSDSSALLAAAQAGHFDCALLLLPFCDPNALYSSGLSVLNQTLSQSKSPGAFDFLKALINAGADPGAVDSDGMDSLRWAIWSNDVKALSLVLPYCDPTLSDQSVGGNGYTPLMIAALERLADHVSLLLPGSDLEARDFCGERADENDDIDPAIQGLIAACRHSRRERLALDETLLAPPRPARAKTL